MSFMKYLTQVSILIVLTWVMPVNAQSNLSVQQLEQQVQANASNALARALLVQAHLLETRDVEAAKALIEKMPASEAESYQLAVANPVNLKPEQLLQVADFYRDMVKKQSGDRAKVAHIRAYSYYGPFEQNPTGSGIDKTRAKYARQLFLKELRGMDVGQAEIQQESQAWTDALLGKPEKVEADPEPEPESTKSEPEAETKTETVENTKPQLKETIGTDPVAEEVELPKIELEFPATAISRIADADQRKRMLALASIKPEDLELDDLKMLSTNFYKLHQEGPASYKKAFAVRALIYSLAIVDKMEGKTDIFVLQANIRRDFTTRYLDGQGGADAMVNALLSKLKPMPGSEPVVQKDPVEDPVKTTDPPKVETPTRDPKKPDNKQQPIAKLNRFKNSLDMQMLRIKPGRFRRGASLTSVITRQDETPHEVVLSRPYFMSKTEVTQKQYEDLMGENPSEVKGPNLPVTNVSWDDAVTFTKALSKKEGRRYRLPTEAEWEYACRAGTETTYAVGGDVLPKEGMAVSFTGGPALTEPMPVNQLKANAWGLVAMHGNVWEWCQDRYAAYPTGTVRNPKGPSDGPRFVLRGGSFLRSEDDARSARRAQALNTAKFNHVGFRVVCEVK